MTELLNQMIITGYEFIETAKKMMKSCRLKDNKHRSKSRLVISFFINRAVELSESFILLIKENRLADSAILLRTLWEMGINTDYIFSDSQIKEINATKYLLNEYPSQIRLLVKNKEEFEAAGLNVKERIKEKQEKLKRAKAALIKEYKVDSWDWPSIFARAKDSKQWVIKQAYNQIYAHTSNIEHHDMSFGQNYVDEDKCEPSKEIRIGPLLRSEINLFMCRSILLVIMKMFNEEFSLKWEDVLKSLEEKHDNEYKEMRKNIKNGDGQ